MNARQTPDLASSRAAIDRIDGELVRLFCERMRISAQIADYKREDNIPILDPVRENALLCRVAALAGAEMEPYVRALYAALLSASRAYQQARIEDADGKDTSPQ